MPSSATRPARPRGAIERALTLVHFDPSPSHRPPTARAVVVATVVAIVASLLADWVIAEIAVAVFPSTKGYPHFAFSDYGELTVIGVVVACVGWPIVARLCSTPRWLFVRLAALVSAVLLLPDLYIYLGGQPGKAVIWLACMHLAIALVTYNSLVRLAPVRRPLRHATPA